MENPRRLVVNKLRFMRCLALIILLLVASTGLLMKISSAESIRKEKNYFEMYIKSGDTLWDLAKRYTPKGKDLRKTIYEISILNELDSTDIYPGQIIKIPIQ
ncbi:cell division suppressor protein YneA [Geosporobacter ferrireducens]|uniref:LysM domain-containing protein n=1 Tax=Geosporobacter ferrireducens TaxID=1424294 RepID=A0A1D8GPT8_9FIRM|nr:LysM peptidoglycan-binding domain-containing protein [Geosporobacter ferrireducens]AOT72917.1 hypothetical protein Gferi_27175 [Geosporobacter ferrireducens]